jgi:hypothetical protein
MCIWCGHAPGSIELQKDHARGVTKGGSGFPGRAVRPNAALSSASIPTIDHCDRISGAGENPEETSNHGRQTNSKQSFAFPEAARFTATLWEAVPATTQPPGIAKSVQEVGPG